MSSIRYTRAHISAICRESSIVGVALGCVLLALFLMYYVRAPGWVRNEIIASLDSRIHLF